MTNDPDLHQERLSLLLDAVRDPFEDFDRFHVTKWFRSLREMFPLLSFQAHRYAALQSAGAPRTEPLQQMITSILTDDGIPQEHQILMEGLDASLDRRRYSLANGPTIYTEHADDIGIPKLYPNYTTFRSAPDLAGYEIVDDDGGVGYISPYEVVGREIAAAVEVRNHARTEEAQHQAETRIDDLLERTGLKRARGRQPSPLTTSVLTALIGEGAELISLVIAAESRTIVLDERPRGVFRSQNVPEGEDVRWAYRLALPILSHFEIQALRRFPPEEVQRRPSTPKRLAALMLERRLRLEQGALTRKVFGSGQAAVAADRENPFAVGRS